MRAPRPRVRTSGARGLQGLVVIDNVPVTVLARQQGSTTVALAAGPAAQRAWADNAISRAGAAGAELSLIRPEEALLTGTTQASGAATVKASSSDTGLPWTVVSGAGPRVVAYFAVA